MPSCAPWLLPLVSDLFQLPSLPAAERSAAHPARPDTQRCSILVGNGATGLVEKRAVLLVDTVHQQLDLLVWDLGTSRLIYH